MADALGIYPPDAEETQLARLREAIKRAVFSGQPLQGRGGYIGDGVLSRTSMEMTERVPPRDLGRVERHPGAADEWRGEMGFSDWQIEQVFGEVPPDERLLRRLWITEEVRRRTLEGLSQRKIASELPISQSTVHRIQTRLRAANEIDADCSGTDEE